MQNRAKRPRGCVIVAAVSGGPDSVYLLRRIASEKKGTRVIAAHVNYRSRGKDSQKDQALVERICRRFGINLKILELERGGAIGGLARGPGRFPSGFEKNARDLRYRFLRDLSRKVGARAIAVAHTADDQVETILMRFFEGAGISGLKGIPRETDHGVVRPILDIWKRDIAVYLKQYNIPYRVDRSNLDTRFERNWIRHVLIPLLEKRYGKGVKKRIFTLGERFRELDDYLETEARKWIRRNVKPGQMENLQIPRGGFSRLPTVVRAKVLQRICFDRLGVAPNERLLVNMDKVVCSRGPSAKVKVGKGWELINRYELAAFVRAGTRGVVSSGEPALTVEEKWKVTPAQARHAAASGGKEYFDAAGIRMPLSVRPLRAGDRIRPFGLEAEKKVKEILIDRKVPKDERWGRPVVCDAEGTVLWIPGVCRSAHAPVVPETKKSLLLKLGRK